MFLSDLALIGIIQLIVLLTGGVFFLLLHVRFLKKQVRSLKAGQARTKPADTQKQQLPEQSSTQTPPEGSQLETTRQSTEHPVTEIPKPTAPVEDASSLSQTEPLSPEPVAPPALDRPTTQDVRPANGTSASAQASVVKEPSPPVAASTAQPSASTASAVAGPEDAMPGEISELIKMLNEELLLTANMRDLIESLDRHPDQVKEILAHQNSTLVHLEQYIRLSQDEADAIETKINHYRDQLIKLKKRLAKFKANTPAVDVTHTAVATNTTAAKPSVKPTSPPVS